MNPMTLDEIHEFITALKADPSVQVECKQLHPDGLWIPYGWNEDNAEFNFFMYRYRIKPKLVEGWVNIYPDGTSSLFYKTSEMARKIAREDALRVAVHMREVQP